MFEAILQQNADPYTIQTATLLQEFTEQWQNGELTAFELKQLTLDLLDAKRIDEITTDLNRKVEISKALQQMYAIVSAVAGFVL